MITNLKNINKKPTDPLTFNEYTYSVTSYKNEYQIWAIQEVWIVGNISVVEKANAATIWSKKAMAMVKWNYNQVMLKVSTWSVDYILAVPSIINADLSDLDLLSIINKKQLVYNNRENLPDSYKRAWYSMTGWFDYVPTGNKVEIYKWSLWLLNWDKGLKKEMIETLKQAYNWSIIGSDFPYADVIKIDTNDLRGVEVLANNYLQNWIILKDDDVLTINNNWFVKSLSGTASILKTDSNWNVYIWWNFYSATLNIEDIVLTNSGGSDWFISKYASNWDLLWARNIWWTSYDSLVDISIDSSWNVYLWWTYQSTMRIWSDNLANSWSTDVFIAKYDNSWSPIWGRKIWWVSNDSISSISTDTSWNIFIWWTFYSANVNIWWTNHVRSWTSDWYFVKYNNAWSVTWSKKIWWTLADYVNAVWVDTSWNSYVWWQFYSATITLSWTLTRSWGDDWFIAKYDSAWTILSSKKVWWTSSDSVSKIYMDWAWNIFLFGYSYSDPLLIGMNKFKIKNLLFNEANASMWPPFEKYISKLNNWLTSTLWTKQILSSIPAWLISIDNSWNSYVWWTYYWGFSFWTDNIILPTSISMNWFVWKYDSSWNEVYGKTLQSQLIASNVKYFWFNKANAMLAVWETVNIWAIHVDSSWNIFVAWDVSEHAKVNVWWQSISNTSFVVKYSSNME